MVDTPSHWAMKEHLQMHSASTLELALKALKAGAWEWTLGSDQVKWDERCYELFNIDPKFPISINSWIERVVPEQRNRVKEMWNRIPNDNGWFEMEFQIEVSDKVRWIRISGHYIPALNDQPSKASGVMTDITDEKYFNQRLLSSQKFFKAVIEDQTELICRIKPNGLIFFTNQAFARFFDSEVHVLLNTFLVDILPIEAFDRIQKEMNSLSLEKEVSNIDLQLVLPQKGHVLIQWTIRAIYMHDTLNEFQLVGRDITLLHQATERIKQSENELDIIFNLLGDAVFLLDVKGNVIKANRLFNVFFYPGVNDGENFFNILPNEIGITINADFDKVVNDNVSKFGKYNVNGRILETKIFPISDDGIVNRVAVYCHDITDIELSRQSLKQSEEKFRLIAENTNDIIMVLSENNVIEYVSPGIALSLGHDPDNLKGKDWWSIILEEDIPLVRDVHEKLQKGVERELVEFRLVNNKGEGMWFETMFQQQMISKGKTSGKIIAVSREIQNRKLAEEQQKQIEKKLNDANLTKDKFFSIIAHDLRSPFTSILGFSRLLNEEYDDFSNDERKMMIKQILTSTESTFQLLDNLLAWAKTQLGRTAFTPEYFDIESLIFETINLSMPQAKMKGVSLKAEVADKNMVYADMNMMRTILRNLLSNAIKYSFDKGTITVETIRESDRMIVSIIDSGTGIEVNTLKALFSLDEKVCSKKGTANEKGTGLGLILCKEFVERNRGEIFVESELGAGTKFSFTVPLTSY